MFDKTMRVLSVVLGILMCFCFLFALLLNATQSVSYRKSFYETQFDAEDAYTAVGMEKEALLEVTDGLIAYIRGDSDNLQQQAVINGETRDFYSERALLHMEDVQKLYGAAKIGKYVFAVVGLGLIIALWFINGEDWFGHVCRGWLRGAIAFLVLMMVILFLATSSFTDIFTRFHELFFSNDLWLLDASEPLIQILPQTFFEAAALQIAIGFAIPAVLITGVVWAVYARWQQGGFRFNVHGSSSRVAQQKPQTPKTPKAPKPDRGDTQAASPDVVSKKKKKRRKG